MMSVERIVILYPGEINSERVSKPGNYSLSRMLIHLHERGYPPVYYLNQSGRHEQWGNIEFIHLTAGNLLKLVARLGRHRNTVILNQMGEHHLYTRMLRAILPNSRVVVRLGGVYFKKDYLESQAFRKEARSHRRRLAVADMIISTADGTPVDLYMEKVGVKPERYRKWLNGFPAIANDGPWERGNRIVCISRLHRGKLVDYVLRSFALALPRLSEPYSLTIVGDGPERDNLRALAQELGVEAHVEFSGHSHEVGQYLYSSRLLLNGLTNNPMMEAIATGTPVITPEFGEVKALYGRFPNVHVVDGAHVGFGAGLAPDMELLTRRTADAVVDVLNNYPSLDVTNLAGKSALYSWEQRLKDEFDMYEELLASAPSTDLVPAAAGPQ